MTSCTSPRSADDPPVRRVGEQVVEQVGGRAQLVDGLQQRDEADPARRRPARSTSPASRASTTAASTSSAPRVIETMYGLARLSGRSGRAASRIAANIRVRACAGVVDSGGGVGASGRRDGQLRGEQPGPVRRGAGPRSASPARRAGRRAAPSAAWWASACSRTSRVASGSPSAATSPDRPVHRAVRGERRRGAPAASRARAAGRRAARRSPRSRCPGWCAAPAGDRGRGCSRSLARMQVTLSRYGSSALSRR